jgi:starch-binding outer membrane protein, SusD/RagB family
MKEMKYIILLLLGLSLTFGSCKKFLAEAPTSSLTDKSQVTSNPGGYALATGCYIGLRVTTEFAQWNGGSTMLALEYATGKGFCQYQSADLYKYEQDIESGDSQYFINPWNSCYIGIQNCNLALKLLPGVTGLSADEKSKLTGEVRALRAWYYFYLVKHYGDVIYNNSVVTDVSNVSRARVSLKTIYDKIIVPDIEYAVNESGLADTRSNDGRVTKHVARMIMADIYITMAGYPYQEVTASSDTTKKWCVDGLWTATDYPVNTQSAKDFLLKAKTQLDFLYGLYPLGDYKDLRDPAMNNKNGAIWEKQKLAGVENFEQVMDALPMNPTTGYTGARICGTVIESQAYYNSYNPVDKRVQEKVFFYSTDTKPKKLDPNESPAPPMPFPFLYKFYDYDAVKNTGQSGLNFPLYRYAEVLLDLTEVNWTLRQLGVSVTDNDIIKGINEVRTAALLPTYVAADIDLLKIMSERAYELIFESKMLWDMRRTRKALIDGSGQFQGLQNFVGHQPTTFIVPFSVKHLLAPVSSTEIDNNRLCLQNFGWSPKQKGQ